ncbi:zinc-ribbon domain-containing protein [Acidianus ambivalens]|uniref:Zinc-ribbon domain-containing protein n=1 Tax=Acidianus ambivalens TaxID=2283 RepID=A0A650CX45_ACIAM|nr:zinc-ribbon domain-containing protein [Acidianus ambivalens]QGR22202.1 zinc-ribbon domain-containing protein [Acidianus ambivalens]
MICPSCGMEIPDGVLQCPNCGYQFQLDQPDSATNTTRLIEPTFQSNMRRTVNCGLKVCTV